MDRLSRLQPQGHAGPAHLDPLPDHRTQMHLDTLRLGIVSHRMLELAQIEIAVELAVDAAQQVAIESSGHAGGIVIGVDQARNRFHQVCTQSLAD